MKDSKCELCGKVRSLDERIIWLSMAEAAITSGKDAKAATKIADDLLESYQQRIAAERKST